MRRVGKAADALAELMKHPELGGPGFITVRFSLTEHPAEPLW